MLPFLIPVLRGTNTAMLLPQRESPRAIRVVISGSEYESKRSICSRLGKDGV